MQLITSKTLLMMDQEDMVPERIDGFIFISTPDDSYRCVVHQPR